MSTDTFPVIPAKAGIHCAKPAQESQADLRLSVALTLTLSYAWERGLSLAGGLGRLAARPAAMLSEGSIVLDHWDACGLGFGRPFVVDDPVLHPDVFDAHFDGLLDHRRHQF